MKVSEVGLGCNNFGMRIDQEGTTAVVNAAIDAGINFFDTADVYGGQGKSEEMLGEALNGRRHEVLVATKFANPMGPRVDQRGGSRKWVVQACEDSLRRLGTDYIDLYQMHRPDPETPIEETLRALDDLITAGKIRYVGNSNFAGWQIAEADAVSKGERLNRFVSAQNNYSLLERRVEHEVLPACDHFGLGMLPFFPLASGLLTGKYKRGEAAPEGTRMAAWGARAQAALNDQNFDKVEKLESYAAERGHTLLELAFAWLLGHRSVSSVIAGATRVEQVNANAGAAGWKLTPDEVGEITALAK
ncbi:MAG TPA: aldo/keto reductase [Caulobacteraceae bacterium]|nr:aldo/keto reductase [Caulobacteraceae bacterium]